MFYVNVNGKQYPLGVTDPSDHDAARAAHAELVSRLASEVAGEISRLSARQQFPNAGPTSSPHLPNASPTVAVAVAKYLETAARKVRLEKMDPQSLRNYRISLKALSRDFGTRLLDTLTAEELEVWADRPEWSASYQNTTLGTVGSLLRANRVTLEPPIQRPSKESRGSASCLSDAQFATVLANVYTSRGKPGDLVPLLKLLRECGARPGEATALTVEIIDWKNCCATLTEHKSKRKTGKNRLLVFNSGAMDVLRGQKDRYGSGLLFRTRGGEKRYGPNVIVKQLIKVSKRVGFRVIAYGLRHAYVTRALERGIAEPIVAALVGHANTAMLANYSHVGSKSRALHDAAERASAYKDAG